MKEDKLQEEAGDRCFHIAKSYGKTNECNHYYIDNICIFCKEEIVR